jgi:hypothetical protein
MFSCLLPPTTWAPKPEQDETESDFSIKDESLSLSLPVSICRYLFLSMFVLLYLRPRRGRLTPIWGHVGVILAYLDVNLRHVGHLGPGLAVLDHIEAILGTMLGPCRAMLNSLGQ